MKTGYVVTIACALVLLWGSTLTAQDSITTDRTVVTARGVETRITQTPGGVGLLEGDELFMFQDISITNSLTRIPGLDKSSDSAWGSAVNIRGLGRNRVVFLIDGSRVNTATDINAQFGFINSNDIERIEVLKGPVSSLYGSGSMGGVVNVITRSGTFSEKSYARSNIGIACGTNPQGVTTFADTSFNSTDFWIYTSAGMRDYDCYEGGNGNDIKNSQFEDAHLTFKSGYQWNPMNVTVLNLQYHKGEDIGIPGKGLTLPTGPTITYPETDRTLLSLIHRLQPENSVWSESELNLFFQEIDRNVLMSFPPAAPMTSIRPSALHTTYGMKWKNVLDFDSHGMVVGLDIWSWEIESERIKNLSSGLTGMDTPLADARQVSAGIFVEEDIMFTPAFTLNLGGRIDYIDTRSDALYNWIKPPAPAIAKTMKRNAESTDDMSWDAHAGLSWNLSAPWSLTVLGAASYRAPDLMDRYKYIVFTGGETYGNPDLDPERSYFGETGIHYRESNWWFSGSLYANRLKNLITEKLQSPGLYRMENVNKALIYGAELEAAWQPAPLWTVYANAAWTVGRNKTDHEDLSFIPPLNGRVGIGYNLSGNEGFYYDINLECARHQDQTAPGELETPGWATVNTVFGYRFSSGRFRHNINIGLDNLFDIDYANHLSTSRGVILSDPGFNAQIVWKMAF